MRAGVPAGGGAWLYRALAEEFLSTPTEEEFLFAIGEAMRQEYQAIVESGFVLQIDDPDLADGWQVHPAMSLAEFRKAPRCAPRR